MDVQLDLFGEIEAAERTRADWLARFEQADWIAPWDTAGGMKKGDSKPGWRCPDPECGKVEPNSTLLANDHGWDPHRPGYEPFDGRCHRLRLLAAHARADAKAAGATETPLSDLGDRAR